MDDIVRVLDDTAIDIEAEAQRAYAKFKELLARGVAPQKAMELVRAEFDPDYYSGIAAAFERLLDARWTAKRVRDYQVGRVTLGKLMYQNWRETTAAVTGIVSEHLKGIQQATTLAMRLYTGYGLLEGEPLRFRGAALDLLPKALRELVKTPGVRSALTTAARRAATAKIRTAALRSAYQQALKADLTAAGRARLDALLKVAMEEKLRYFANRIAQTELARAFALTNGKHLMADATISVVQWRLSGNHPVEDICDLFANVDSFGLGAGCYPKGQAPSPPVHPFCRCRLRSRPDLSAAVARFDPGAERAFLAKLPARQAAKVMGSREKLEQVLQGSTAREAWNAGIAEAHQVHLLGQAGPLPPDLQPEPEPIPSPAPIVPVLPVLPPAPFAQQIRTLDEFIAAGNVITRTLPSAATDASATAAALMASMRSVGLIGQEARVATGGAGAALVKRASAQYPSTWVQAADRLGRLNVRQSRARAFQYTAEADRPISRLSSFGIVRDVKAGEGFILTNADMGAAVHEFGHRIQASLPELDQLFQELHRRRTAGDSLERLATLKPRHGYGRHEVTRKDKYVDPYQGREYDRGGALEVLTMVYEPMLALANATPLEKSRLAERLQALYVHDRELFDLAVGLLFHFRP